MLAQPLQPYFVVRRNRPYFTAAAELEHFLDLFVEYGHRSGKAYEVGGRSRTTEGRIVDRYEDVDDNWNEFFEGVKKALGSDVAVRGDNAHGQVLCRESQKSFLRGGLHAWAYVFGVELPDEIASALVDDYAKTYG